jgi:S-layer family protein
MKSLVTTFLVFATCLVIAGTIALIDRAQATLALSSGESAQLTPAETARLADTTTLSEFANEAQEKFALPQPDAPVAFDDVRPSDPTYNATQAVYPFLHRQLLCPDCAVTLDFYGKSPLTRAQAAIALVSILIRERKITLATPDKTADVLANVSDADSVSVFVRPYIATALAEGILTLEPGNLVGPSEPYTHIEMTALFDTVQRRFPPSERTACLRLGHEEGR